MFRTKHKIFVVLFLLVFGVAAIFVSHSSAALIGNTNQATLSFSPQSGTYNANAVIPIGIYLNTNGQNVVVVAAYLNYDKTHFEAVSIDSTNSVFTMEAEKIIDATNGVIKITRGIPSANHINSSNALVAVINFRAISGITPSVDNLTFQFTAGSTLDSNVIKDDGLGTEILSGVYNGKYTITGGTADIQVPAVTAFTIPSTATSLTVAINSFTATDNIGVSGYIVTESSSAPSSGASGWSASAPTSYVFSSAGSKTLYAWAKDAAGNVSASRSAAVSITTIDVTAPVISSVTASSITSNSAVIAWTTNESSDSQVEYGTSASYGSQTTLNSSMITSHSIVISNLSSLVNYHYRVKSKDATGNLTTSGDYNFTTTAGTTSGLLSVALEANPSSGKAPLIGVDLTAAVSGTVTGNANYTFYCNRSDNNTTIIAGYVGKYDNKTEAIYTAVDACDFTSAGTYLAKVVVERGSYQAEARTTITVSSANSLPIGAIDGVDQAHVTGWAFDTDAGANPISVHIYIDGVNKVSITANLSRPDIVGAGDRAVGDGNHGFDYSFSSLGLSTGSHRVNIYAINTPEGINPELTGSPRNFSVGDTSSPSPSPSSSPSPSPAPSPKPIGDGSLIRSADDPKIYVIDDGERRWVPSLDAFVAHGYSWSNVQVVDNSVINQYSEVEPVAATVVIPSEHANATLVRLVNNAKVYALIDTKLHWVPSPTVFSLYEYQWSKIQTVSSAQFNQYGQFRLIKAVGGNKIYYLTKSGQKKWIINETVFNAYGNKWEDVLEVLSEEIYAYPNVTLVRQNGDIKVYLLEDTIKHWVTTSEIFAQRGYKWEDVDVINQAEINEYQEGSAIE